MEGRRWQCEKNAFQLVCTTTTIRFMGGGRRALLDVTVIRAPCVQPTSFYTRRAYDRRNARATVTLSPLPARRPDHAIIAACYVCVCVCIHFRDRGRYDERERTCVCVCVHTGTPPPFVLRNRQMEFSPPGRRIFNRITTTVFTIMCV